MGLNSPHMNGSFRSESACRQTHRGLSTDSLSYTHAQAQSGYSSALYLNGGPNGDEEKSIVSNIKPTNPTGICSLVQLETGISTHTLLL